MEEVVNLIGDTKRSKDISGKERQKSITDSEIQNRCSSDFMEPPYTAFIKVYDFGSKLNVIVNKEKDK